MKTIRLQARTRAAFELGAVLALSAFLYGAVEVVKAASRPLSSGSLLLPDASAHGGDTEEIGIG